MAQGRNETLFESMRLVALPVCRPYYHPIPKIFFCQILPLVLVGDGGAGWPVHGNSKNACIFFRDLQKFFDEANENDDWPSAHESSRKADY
jgi:hypothetical protein